MVASIRILIYLRTCFKMGATAGLSSSARANIPQKHCWTSQQWHPKNHLNPISKHVLIIAAVFLVAGAGVASAQQQPVIEKPTPPGLAYPFSSSDRSTISILDEKGRPVMRYRFADVRMKPYVDQLFTPGGVQVLRDSAPDHPHHHGLMYAVSVDGVDFWGEVGRNYGKQVQRKIGNAKHSVKDGIRRVVLIQELDWVGPESDKPLLIERRKIGEYRADDLGATLLEWDCSLETPPDKESIKLTGHHYFGLGMRFVESMDRDGRFFNSDDRRGEVVRGDERLTPAKWCAYTAAANGRPVTVALFDHPDNLRHPARMFTMSKPFAYLSATMNEWKEPVEVKAGRPLELRYAVAVWDGEVDKATVERLYKRWLEINAKGEPQKER